MSTDFDEEIIAEVLGECREVLEEAAARLSGIAPGEATSDDVDNLFRTYHTVKGTTAMIDFMGVSDFAHQVENGLSRVRDAGGTMPEDQIMLLTEATDRLAALIDKAEATGKSTCGPSEYIFLGRMAQAFGTDGSIVKKTAQAAENRPTNENEGEQEHAREVVKVDMRQLNELMSLAGELMLLERRVRFALPDRDGAQEEDHALHEIASDLDNMVNRLYDRMLSIRRVPASTIVSRLERAARDASRKEKKLVDLVIEGKSLLIDRSTLTTLQDPLMHLLRNAISHGVEDTAERAESGKTAAAKVTVTITEDDNSVFVNVVDDGRGIDPSKIRARVISRNLEPRKTTDATPDSDIVDWIFRAGFSTAETVTEVSGRGVGLDVVRSNIEDAGGVVGVTSNLGTGTRFSLTIPKAALPVLDGLIVKLGKTVLMVPTVSVMNILEGSSAQFIHLSSGKTVVRVEDEVYPVFGTTKVADGRPLGVLVNDGKSGFFLGVNSIIGRERVLLSHLDGWLTLPPYMSDAFILGNGRLGFVLDVEAAEIAHLA